MLKSLRWVIGIMAVCGVVLIVFTAFDPKVQRFMGLLEPNDLPPPMKRVLDSGETFVLYSLDPHSLYPPTTPEEEEERASYKETFHKYGVLGKAEVKDARQRAELLSAFYQSMSEHDGSVAACFNPRHGISVTAGDETVDLVICFECHSTEVYSPEESVVHTSASAGRTFRRVVDRLGLPQPKN